MGCFKLHQCFGTLVALVGTLVAPFAHINAAGVFQATRATGMPSVHINAAGVFRSRRATGYLLLTQILQARIDLLCNNGAFCAGRTTWVSPGHLCHPRIARLVRSILSGLGGVDTYKPLYHMFNADAKHQASNITCK